MSVKMSVETYSALALLRLALIGEGAIVACTALDQAIVDQLCDLIRVQHKALREIYSEQDVAQELQSILEHPEL